MKTIPLLIASIGMVASSAALAQQAPVASAFAAMKGRDGTDHGTVTFNQLQSGQLQVLVEMTGLPPGPHAFHIHSVGVCDGPGGFESAGPHFSAEGEQHGHAHAEGPHLGDLPNVNVGQDGVLKAEFFTTALSIGGDRGSMLDADGSSVMLHAGPDDHESQPAGDSGDRIVCGIVEQPG